MFTIEAVGLAEAIAHYDRMEQVLLDLTLELEEAVLAFGEVESEFFGSRGNGTWASLTPGTQDYRAQEGFSPDDILERTGALLNKLANPEIFAQSPLAITAGAADRGGYFQQMGFTQRWKVQTVGDNYQTLVLRDAPYQQQPRKPIDIAQANWQEITARFARVLLEELNR